LVVADPSLLTGFIVGIKLARQVPKVLAGMEEIDDLNRAGEVLAIPNPLGAIA
jgi:hypothetical protein